MRFAARIALNDKRPLFGVVVRHRFMQYGIVMKRRVRLAVFLFNQDATWHVAIARNEGHTHHDGDYKFGNPFHHASITGSPMLNVFSASAWAFNFCIVISGLLDMPAIDTDSSCEITGLLPFAVIQ